MSWQRVMRKVGTTSWEFFSSNLEMAHVRITAGMKLIRLLRNNICKTVRVKVVDDLKRRMEKTMAKSSFMYVTYIRTAPEKLWSALTDAEFMKLYWFGMHCESLWTAGSSWKLMSGDGH